MEILKKTILAAIILIFLAACSNEDPSLDTSYFEMGNVENPQNSNAFYINLDDGSRLWTAATNLSNYRPKDGTRIIANFSILAEQTSEAYDYDVKLHDVYEVLTKPIFKITPETEDSIGNDRIRIQQIWISKDYLNIGFFYYGYANMHYINLVPANPMSDGDGNIYLEFRHNANKDLEEWLYKGYVSFELEELKETYPDMETLMLSIAVNDFTGEKVMYELKYNTKENKQESQEAFAIIHDDLNSEDAIFE